jgi:hypothetical protein
MITFRLLAMLSHPIYYIDRIIPYCDDFVHNKQNKMETLAKSDINLECF